MELKKVNGALILTLGILSLTGFGAVAAIPAWILGRNALRDIAAGRADPAEYNLVKVGYTIGMVVTCLMGVVITLVVGITIWGVTHRPTSPFDMPSYDEMLRDLPKEAPKKK